MGINIRVLLLIFCVLMEFGFAGVTELPPTLEELPLPQDSQDSIGGIDSDAAAIDDRNGALGRGSAIQKDKIDAASVNEKSILDSGHTAQLQDQEVLLDSPSVNSPVTDKQTATKRVPHEVTKEEKKGQKPLTETMDSSGKSSAASKEQSTVGVKSGQEKSPEIPKLTTEKGNPLSEDFNQNFASNTLEHPEISNDNKGMSTTGKILTGVGVTAGVGLLAGGVAYLYNNYKKSQSDGADNEKNESDKITTGTDLKEKTEGPNALLSMFQSLSSGVQGAFSGKSALSSWFAVGGAGLAALGGGLLYKNSSTGGENDLISQAAKTSLFAGGGLAAAAGVLYTLNNKEDVMQGISKVISSSGNGISSLVSAAGSALGSLKSIPSGISKIFSADQGSAIVGAIGTGLSALGAGAVAYEKTHANDDGDSAIGKILNAIGGSTTLLATGGVTSLVSSTLFESNGDSLKTAVSNILLGKSYDEGLSETQKSKLAGALVSGGSSIASLGTVAYSLFDKYMKSSGKGTSSGGESSGSSGGDSGSGSTSTGGSSTGGFGSGSSSGNGAFGPSTSKPYPDSGNGSNIFGSNPENNLFNPESNPGNFVNPFGGQQQSTQKNVQQIAQDRLSTTSNVLLGTAAVGGVAAIGGIGYNFFSNISKKYSENTGEEKGIMDLIKDSLSGDKDAQAAFSGISIKDFISGKGTIASLGGIAVSGLSMFMNSQVKSSVTSGIMSGQFSNYGPNSAGVENPLMGLVQGYKNGGLQGAIVGAFGGKTGGYTAESLLKQGYGTGVMGAGVGTFGSSGGTSNSGFGTTQTTGMSTGTKVAIGAGVAGLAGLGYMYKDQIMGALGLGGKSKDKNTETTKETEDASSESGSKGLLDTVKNFVSDNKLLLGVGGVAAAGAGAYFLSDKNTNQNPFANFSSGFGTTQTTGMSTGTKVAIGAGVTGFAGLGYMYKDQIMGALGLGDKSKDMTEGGVPSESGSKGLPDTVKNFVSDNKLLLGVGGAVAATGVGAYLFKNRDQSKSQYEMFNQQSSITTGTMVAGGVAAGAALITGLSYWNDSQNKKKQNAQEAEDNKKNFDVVDNARKGMKEADSKLEEAHKNVNDLYLKKIDATRKNYTDSKQIYDQFVSERKKIEIELKAAEDRFQSIPDEYKNEALGEITKLRSELIAAQTKEDNAKKVHDRSFAKLGEVINMPLDQEGLEKAKTALGKANEDLEHHNLIEKEYLDAKANLDNAKPENIAEASKKYFDAKTKYEALPNKEGLENTVKSAQEEYDKKYNENKSSNAVLEAMAAVSAAESEVPSSPEKIKDAQNSLAQTIRDNKVEVKFSSSEKNAITAAESSVDQAKQVAKNKELEFEQNLQASAGVAQAKRELDRDPSNPMLQANYDKEVSKAKLAAANLTEAEKRLSENPNDEKAKEALSNAQNQMSEISKADSVVNSTEKSNGVLGLSKTTLVTGGLTAAAGLAAYALSGNGATGGMFGGGGGFSSGFGGGQEQGMSTGTKVAIGTAAVGGLAAVAGSTLGILNAANGRKTDGTTGGIIGGLVGGGALIATLGGVGAYMLSKKNSEQTNNPFGGMGSSGFFGSSGGSSMFGGNSGAAPAANTNVSNNTGMSTGTKVAIGAAAVGGITAIAGSILGISKASGGGVDSGTGRLVAGLAGGGAVLAAIAGGAAYLMSKKTPETPDKGSVPSGNENLTGGGLQNSGFSLPGGGGVFPSLFSNPTSQSKQVPISEKKAQPLESQAQGADDKSQSLVQQTPTVVAKPKTSTIAPTPKKVEKPTQLVQYNPKAAPKQFIGTRISQATKSAVSSVGGAFTSAGNKIKAGVTGAKDGVVKMGQAVKSTTLKATNAMGVTKAVVTNDDDFDDVSNNNLQMIAQKKQNVDAKTEAVNDAFRDMEKFKESDQALYKQIETLHEDKLNEAQKGYKSHYAEIMSGNQSILKNIVDTGGDIKKFQDNHKGSNDAMKVTLNYYDKSLQKVKEGLEMKKLEQANLKREISDIDITLQKIRQTPDVNARNLLLDAAAKKYGVPAADVERLGRRKTSELKKYNQDIYNAEKEYEEAKWHFENLSMQQDPEGYKERLLEERARLEREETAITAEKNEDSEIRRLQKNVEVTNQKLAELAKDQKKKRDLILLEMTPDERKKYHSDEDLNNVIQNREQEKKELEEKKANNKNKLSEEDASKLARLSAFSEGTEGFKEANDTFEQVQRDAVRSQKLLDVALLDKVQQEDVKKKKLEEEKKKLTQLETDNNAIIRQQTLMDYAGDENAMKQALDEDTANLKIQNKNLEEENELKRQAIKNDEEMIKKKQSDLAELRKKKLEDRTNTERQAIIHLEAEIKQDIQNVGNRKEDYDKQIKKNQKAMALNESKIAQNITIKQPIKNASPSLLDAASGGTVSGSAKETSGATSKEPEKGTPSKTPAQPSSSGSPTVEDSKGSQGLLEASNGGPGAAGGNGTSSSNDGGGLLDAASGGFGKGASTPGAEPSFWDKWGNTIMAAGAGVGGTGLLAALIGSGGLGNLTEQLSAIPDALKSLFGISKEAADPESSALSKSAKEISSKEGISGQFDLIKEKNGIDLKEILTTMEKGEDLSADQIKKLDSPEGREALQSVDKVFNTGFEQLVTKYDTYIQSKDINKLKESLKTGLTNKDNEVYIKGKLGDEVYNIISKTVKGEALDASQDQKLAEIKQSDEMKILLKDIGDKRGVDILGVLSAPPVTARIDFVKNLSQEEAKEKTLSEVKEKYGVDVDAILKKVKSGDSLTKEELAALKNPAIKNEIQNVAEISGVKDLDTVIHEKKMEQIEKQFGVNPDDVIEKLKKGEELTQKEKTALLDPELKQVVDDLSKEAGVNVNTMESLNSKLAEELKKEEVKKEIDKNLDSKIDSVNLELTKLKDQLTALSQNNPNGVNDAVIALKAQEIQNKENDIKKDVQKRFYGDKDAENAISNPVISDALKAIAVPAGAIEIGVLLKKIADGEKISQNQINALLSDDKIKNKIKAIDDSQGSGILNLLTNAEKNFDQKTREALKVTSAKSIEELNKNPGALTSIAMKLTDLSPVSVNNFAEIIKDIKNGNAEQHKELIGNILNNPNYSKVKDELLSAAKEQNIDFISILKNNYTDLDKKSKEEGDIRELMYGDKSAMDLMKKLSDKEGALSKGLDSTPDGWKVKDLLEKMSKGESVDPKEIEEVLGNEALSSKLGTLEKLTGAKITETLNKYNEQRDEKIKNYQKSNAMKAIGNLMEGKNGGVHPGIVEAQLLLEDHGIDNLENTLQNIKNGKLSPEELDSIKNILNDPEKSNIRDELSKIGMRNGIDFDSILAYAESDNVNKTFDKDVKERQDADVKKDTKAESLLSKLENNPGLIGSLAGISKVHGEDLKGLLENMSAGAEINDAEVQKILTNPELRRELEKIDKENGTNILDTISNYNKDKEKRVLDLKNKENGEKISELLTDNKSAIAYGDVLLKNQGINLTDVLNGINGENPHLHKESIDKLLNDPKTKEILQDIESSYGIDIKSVLEFGNEKIKKTEETQKNETILEHFQDPKAKLALDKINGSNVKAVLDAYKMIYGVDIKELFEKMAHGEKISPEDINKVVGNPVLYQKLDELGTTSGVDFHNIIENYEADKNNRDFLKRKQESEELLTALLPEGKEAHEGVAFAGAVLDSYGVKNFEQMLKDIKSGDYAKYEGIINNLLNSQGVKDGLTEAGRIHGVDFISILNTTKDMISHNKTDNEKDLIKKKQSLTLSFDEHGNVNKTKINQELSKIAIGSNGKTVKDLIDSIAAYMKPGATELEKSQYEYTVKLIKDAGLLNEESSVGKEFLGVIRDIDTRYGGNIEYALNEHINSNVDFAAVHNDYKSSSKELEWFGSDISNHTKVRDKLESITLEGKNLKSVIDDLSEGSGPKHDAALEFIKKNDILSNEELMNSVSLVDSEHGSNIMQKLIEYTPEVPHIEERVPVLKQQTSNKDPFAGVSPEFRKLFEDLNDQVKSLKINLEEEKNKTIQREILTVENKEQNIEHFINSPEFLDKLGKKMLEENGEFANHVRGKFEDILHEHAAAHHNRTNINTSKISAAG